MSFETAALVNARPGMIAVQVRELLSAEIVKGCQREIASHPVALEPSFMLLSHDAFGQGGDEESDASAVESFAPSDLARFNVWISPEQECDWLRSELFLKQLRRVRSRIAFEICGNHERIDIRLLCHRADTSVVRSAFYAVFERCELTPARQDILQDLPRIAWDEVVFEDCVPRPPYSHLFTRPGELRISPYGAIVGALAGIPSPAVGLYQVVFQPVAPQHDWHHNVGRLINYEFNYELMAGLLPTQRYAQQVPTGDLHHLARDTETKAHPDKPFFAGALRIAVLGAGRQAAMALDALSTFSSLIQHGGRPLDRLTERDYLRHLPQGTLRDMFTTGQTYRPGFILNSWELTTLVHVPSADITEHRPTPIPKLETLPADASLAHGVPVGVCSYADRKMRTCIPPTLRTQHCHVIGVTGCGKSNMLMQMGLHDINGGHGIAVFDPHGSLVQQLLHFIPEQHVDRVLYINPGDRDWVPIWNPLRCSAGFPLGRVAGNLVSAFRAFVTGWGHRLEHLLRHAILASLHLPDGTLHDVADLLRKGSEESNILRTRVKPLLKYRLMRSFWERDFDRYNSADLTPPQHKLSKLLTVGSESLMLSQPDTSFEFGNIIASGKILLVDLSDLDEEAMEVVGCFMLSLIYLAAMARRDKKQSGQHPFHVYCDEAHRFVTDTIEDMITQMRKRDVSLTMAHQYMSQFSIRKTDAISGVSSSVIFRVNSTDAAYLKKNLQGRVALDELTALPDYEAIARIGTQIVRIKTLPPPPPRTADWHDLIIERSRKRYYRPVAEVERTVRERYDRCYEPLTPGDTTDATRTTRRRSGSARRTREMEQVFKYEEL